MLIKFNTKDSFLSNEYKSPFFYNGTLFQNATKAYQKEKSNFSSGELSWKQQKINVMFSVILQKFRQNKNLYKQLITTKDDEIVYANENDTFWGVGLSGEDVTIENKSEWKGENNLGKILMNVRELLLSENAHNYCTQYVALKFSDFTVLKIKTIHSERRVDLFIEHENKRAETISVYGNNLTFNLYNLLIGGSLNKISYEMFTNMLTNIVDGNIEYK